MILNPWVIYYSLRKFLFLTRRYIEFILCYFSSQYCYSIIDYHVVKEWQRQLDVIEVIRAYNTYVVCPNNLCNIKLSPPFFNHSVAKVLSTFAADLFNDDLQFIDNKS